MEKLVERIREMVFTEQYEYSEHGLDQSIIRRISTKEVLEAIETGEVIEDYPDDKYGPSCLILGKTKSGRPLHVQCSYPLHPLIKIITVYEPDPNEWINFKVRK